ALYQVFLDVRDAAASILEGTTLAELVAKDQPSVRPNKHPRSQKKDSASILPMVVGRPQQ
ncbi:MAG: hypothetical protein WA477_04840, partial [Candidatus Sulfotelmatobacter sp.]